jgi:hypothetical protein
MSSLLSLFVGFLFISSLALALGVGKGSSKSSEVLYMLFWYFGLLNKVSGLVDYIGSHTTVYWTVYLFLSVILVLLIDRTQETNPDWISLST